MKAFSVFATRDEAAENDDDSDTEEEEATSRTLMSVESLTPVMTVITSFRATSACHTLQLVATIHADRVEADTSYKYSFCTAL